MSKQLDSSKNHRARSGALFSGALLLLPASVFAGSIDLSFGTLPSAQGFTYTSTSGTPENQIFSTNGTTLFLNSESLAASANGGYILSGGYNPAIDTTIDIVMQVNEGTTAGSNDFQVRGGSELFDFGFSDSGVRIQGSTFVPLTTTSAFNDYKIFLPGGSGTYSLYQNGILESSGSAISGSFGAGFLSFGEEDTNGSGSAEITQLNYTVAPEPASWMLCTLAVSGLALKWRNPESRRRSIR